MRLALVGAVCGVLLTAGCGGGSDETATDDPSASPTAAASDAPMPTDSPAAPGLVSTRGVVTVIDEGDGPEACLGPVAESYPPQCSGPAISGWTWSEHRPHEQQGKVTWGEFALTGRWDGATFAVTAAVPSASYDGAAPTEPTPPRPLRQYSDADLTEIARTVSTLPGAVGSYVDANQVHVGVAYDDGSLQAWADAAYGENVVVVSPQLLDERP